MRGPYERLKYDFRRVFECPVCRHRERPEGPATSCVCECQKKLDPRVQRPMLLVEEGGRRVTEPPPRATPAVVGTPLPDPVAPESASPAAPAGPESSIGPEGPPEVQV